MVVRRLRLHAAERENSLPLLCAAPKTNAFFRQLSVHDFERVPKSNDVMVNIASRIFIMDAMPPLINLLGSVLHFSEAAIFYLQLLKFAHHR